MHSVDSSECRKLGYTYGMHNAIGVQIGCAKINGDMIETYNYYRDETAYEHKSNAWAIYKLKD